MIVVNCDFFLPNHLASASHGGQECLFKNTRFHCRLVDFSFCKLEITGLIINKRIGMKEGKNACPGSTTNNVVLRLDSMKLNIIFISYMRLTQSFLLAIHLWLKSTSWLLLSSLLKIIGLVYGLIVGIFSSSASNSYFARLITRMSLFEENLQWPLV